MDRNKILDDIFAAGESTPEEDLIDQLKEINVNLENIEDDLSILVQYITGSIQC